ncbi:MAG: SH3 domain-containing protein [Anaerolineae bacterium]|nr:SH3 domain-containing protein [Anaerolineae bacterium]
MFRKMLLLSLVLMLSATAHGQVTHAQGDILPEGEWRAYPLEESLEYAYKMVKPLYDQPFVPLLITVRPKSIAFKVNDISVAAQDLSATLEVTLQLAEDGYRSEQVKMGDTEFSGRSTFSLVPISPTRALLTESHVAFEGTRSRRWLLTFAERNGDPREALKRCEGAPPSRLVIGKRAVVLGEQPSNVRAQPSLRAMVLFQAPPYISPEDSARTAVLEVLEGPVCSDSFAWWRVRLDNREGWAAEGDLEGYYLEFFEPEGTQALDSDPVTEQLRPTPTPTPSR